jgi:response regulator NasT
VPHFHRAPPASSAAKVPAVTEPLRVAVAEDDPDALQYLQELLARLGHQAVAAQTGRQLVELCRAASPDLVIADIKMPDLDGIDAAAAINRERPAPVILLSAHDDDDVLSRLVGSHVFGYLVKPVNAANIKTAIALALLRYRHFQALTVEAADLRQALEDRKVIERAKGALMRRLRVDEEEAFRHLRSLASEQNLKLVEVGRRILAAEEVFSQLDWR